MVSYLKNSTVRALLATLALLWVIQPGALHASQPPAGLMGRNADFPMQTTSSASALSGCNRSVIMAVGERSMVGWVGNELVSMVKRGMQFFGTHQNKPVRLQLIGSQESGYRLRGYLDGEAIDWKIEDDLVSAELTHCPQ